MLEELGSILLEKAGEKAAEAFYDFVLKDKELEKATCVTVASTTRDALRHHAVAVRKWASQVQFSDLPSSKAVTSIYVELETYATRVSKHLSPTDKLGTRPLLGLIAATPRHSVVLGQPGAGKTTSLQKLCMDYFRTGKALKNYNLPLLIRLRDIRDTQEAPHMGILYSAIQGLLKISFNLPKTDDPRRYRPAVEQALESYVDELGAIVLLDGYDELPSDDLKQRILYDFRKLASHLSKSKMILTCRPKEFPYEIEYTETCEICPLTDKQIEEFALRWLQDAAMSTRFLDDVKRSTFYDTAIRPLTLAHLCAIYERTGGLPDKPKTVYRKVITLLLEEWDQQRAVRRHTAYNSLSIDRKFELLSQLAYLLTSEFKASQFSRDELQRSCGMLLPEFGIQASESLGVAREIESHHGLIIESGFETFEFSHKSLQEYLAADYLVRLPSIDIVVWGVTHMPAELAIAIALSSRPTDFFSEVVLRWLKPMNFDNSDQFFNSLVARITLEKVDLYQTLQSKLAACIVCARVNRASLFDTPIDAILPKIGDRSLRGYYEIEVKNELGFFLRRVNKDNRQLFPGTMWLPRKVDPQVAQALDLY